VLFAITPVSNPPAAVPTDHADVVFAIAERDIKYALVVSVAAPAEIDIVAELPAVDIVQPAKYRYKGTLAAVPPIFRAAAVPVIFVPTNAEGVPRFGVTSVGLVFVTYVEPVPVLAAVSVAVVAVAAFRLATSVVEATTKGGVPVATVEVI
jgi:hypothetical protein